MLTKNLNEQVIGKDITLLITVKDETGAAKDISGSTSNFSISTAYGAGGTLLGSVEGSFVDDGTDGKIEFNMPNTSTANALVGTNYVYEIDITLSNGRKYPLRRGEVKFVGTIG